MMLESWRPCIGGNYEVSDLGRVRRRTPAKGTRVGRLMTLQPTKTGYLSVTVRAPRERPKSRLVHQLVADAFLGRCAPGEENGRALLTGAQVLEIRQAATLGKTRVELATRYGVARSTIDAVIRRVNWRHLA